MEEQKISVIIPIYKVEKYIDQCIESVLCQTYSNLQVILVDDGSPDNCGIICDKYARKDKRVTVVHKENGGLSDARNIGTDNAIGEFIFYIDSDDYLETNALELLMDFQKASNSDVVFGNYWYTYSGHEELAKSSFLENKCLNNFEAMDALMSGKIETFAWGKIIRSNIAKKYLFPVGKVFEDHYWTHCILGDSFSVAYVNAPMIHYRQREDSISYTFNLSRLDALDGWCIRKQYLEQNYPDLIKVFLNNCAKQYVDISWIILTRMKNNKREAFDKLRKINRTLSLEKYASDSDRVLIEALNASNFKYCFLAIYSKVRNRL